MADVLPGHAVVESAGIVLDDQVRAMAYDDEPLPWSLVIGICGRCFRTGLGLAAAAFLNSPDSGNLLLREAAPGHAAIWGQAQRSNL
jgi:hypothetical protein